ncbi:MAG: GatB/YqeY domain-containing protein [Rhodocyclaceae bacterium]|nr:GatB/YqeY domain-containing protein [Rhodocyclaceae bacterium]
MSLKTRISDDMKAAMKARDSQRLSAVRMLLAAIKQREVDERIELDDAGVIAVVERAVKQRKDAASQYEAAGREDLAGNERFEIEVLSAYLPAQLDDAAIAEAVRAAIESTGASGPADMGRVMGQLKGTLAGQADMSLVSTHVRRALTGKG